MAEGEDDRARVLQLQGEWFRARAEHDRIVEQFVWTGVKAGQALGRAPRLFDYEGVLEVRGAAETEALAFKSYQEALAPYVGGNQRGR